MLLSFKVLGLAAVVSHVAAASSPPRILLFTGTAGFRHDSIPTAVQTISSNTTWQTTHTENATFFEDLNNLNSFDALVFVHTTDKDPPEVGAPLTDAGAKNVGRYMQQGGNFVGVHSATNTLYAFPFYGRMIGAFFDYHNQLGPMSIRAATNNHPSTQTFPPVLNISEEYYHFRSDPRFLPTPATVLLVPSNYTDAQVAQTPPLAWYREGNLLADVTDPRIPASANLSGGDPSLTSGGAGRSFFTSLGHLNETWQDPVFQAHVFGGISWAIAKSSASTSTSANSSQSSLPSETSSRSTTSGATQTMHVSLLLAAAMTLMLLVQLSL